jgi:V8-like Glu-specific endopeptidase
MDQKAKQRSFTPSTRKPMISRKTIALMAILALSGTPALAGSTAGISNSGSGRLSAAQRDAARDFANPLPLPDTSQVKAATSLPGSPAGAVSGSPDGKPVTPGMTPQAYGSFGIPYTATRVALGSTKGKQLSASYPYRAVGRLTFLSNLSSAVYTGPYNSLCTASLIRRSVLVTAAHCVMGFGTDSFYTGWQFTPSYYRASNSSTVQTPYGIWDWSAVRVANSWRFGTDSGAGAARNNDLAVIVLAKSTTGRFIGDLTGYLGYGWNSPSFVKSSKTGDIVTAAVSTLGYPCLLDNCRIMQRTDGPTYPTTVGTALQYWQGSNMTAGSSGAPWVVNFKSQDPVYSSGASAGTMANMYVVGVTSWGSVDPNANKDNYASRFGQNDEFPDPAYGSYGAGNIGALLEDACNMTGPGGTSYASQGYCD